MPRGGSVKIKKVSAVSKDDAESLNKMFEQMTGLSNAEPEVIIPKMLKVKQIVVKYHKLFSIVVNFTEFKTLLDEYADWFKDIENFITNLKESNHIDLGENYSHEDMSNILQLQNLDADVLNQQYKNLKENAFIKQIIITCSNLENYKIHIKDKDNLSDKFIKREPGLSLIPFSFSGLDLKVLWSLNELSEQGKKFLLSIVHHSYVIGHDLYEIVSSPDVDIAKFSSILVESITKMRKQIPRCDKAFDVIENSVKMLENNFTTYYRCSVEAENPSIIVESFIIDVSTSQSASPLVNSQFKRIVSFLKQKSSGINDPKIKKLFGMLNNQFSAMDAELGVKKTSAQPEGQEEENADGDDFEQDEVKDDDCCNTNETPQ
jgi:hypothetical protein